MDCNLLEHHREFLKRVFADTRLIASLDLLFQVVLHTHAKLVQLIPLLSQSNSTRNKTEKSILKCLIEGLTNAITCAQCSDCPR